MEKNTTIIILSVYAAVLVVVGLIFPYAGILGLPMLGLSLLENPALVVLFSGFLSGFLSIVLAMSIMQQGSLSKKVMVPYSILMIAQALPTWLLASHFPSSGGWWEIEGSYLQICAVASVIVGLLTLYLFGFNKDVKALFTQSVMKQHEQKGS